jgi:hypothetical protein
MSKSNPTFPFLANTHKKSGKVEKMQASHVVVIGWFAAWPAVSPQGQIDISKGVIPARGWVIGRQARISCHCDTRPEM